MLLIARQTAVGLDTPSVLLIRQQLWLPILLRSTINPVRTSAGRHLCQNLQVPLVCLFGEMPLWTCCEEAMLGEGRGGFAFFLSFLFFVSYVCVRIEIQKDGYTRFVSDGPTFPFWYYFSEGIRLSYWGFHKQPSFGISRQMNHSLRLFPTDCEPFYQWKLNHVSVQYSWDVP